MSQQRRRFEAAEKVKIIREHLLDKRPLSEVCEQYGIAPTQFYQWQKQFFEHGTAAFGFSRSIVHWDIRESMTEREVEVILQQAHEKYPDATPRIISDNGPQFIARDFKEFIRLSGMTHVRTSPYYPQSNGKLERYHKTIKGDCIRVKTPLSLEDAHRSVADFVRRYNTERLHSAIGYITPQDKLEGRAEAIQAERQRKLIAAGEARKQQRKAS
jgi:transposase InsO family protein